MNKTLGLKIYIIFFAMFSIDHFLKTLRGKELNCLVCSYLIDTNTRSKFHQNLWNSSGKCFTNWSFLHGMILIVDLLLSWVIGQPVQGLLNKELSILITWQDLKISTKFEYQSLQKGRDWSYIAGISDSIRNVCETY